MVTIESLYFSLLVFVIFYMLLLNSGNTKAVTYDELKQYVNYTADYYSQNSNYQRIKNVVNNNTTFIEKIENDVVPLSNYNNFCIYSASTSNVVIEMYNVTRWDITTTNIWYYGRYSLCMFDIGSSTWQIGNDLSANDKALANGYSCRQQANKYNDLQGMNYTSEDIQSIYTLPSTYVGMQAVPQYTILTYDNYITDYTSVNNFTTYYRMTDIYRASLFMIGEVHPYDSYYYEIRFRNYKTQQIIGEVFASENPFNPYNTGALTLNLAHQLGVKSLYLNYNTQYELEITSYYGDGGSNLEVLKNIIYLFLLILLLVVMLYYLMGLVIILFKIIVFKSLVLLMNKQEFFRVCIMIYLHLIQVIFKIYMVLL